MLSRRRRFLLSIASIASVIATASAFAEAGECTRVRPSVLPAWATGGAWGSDGTLMLLEPMNGRVLRYDTRLEGVSTLPGRMGEALANLRPRSMQTRDEGFVLQLPRDVFLFLDSTYRMTRMVDVAASFEDFYPWQWHVTGDDLIVCGELVPAKEEDWESGIFRIPLSAPDRYETLLEMKGKYDPYGLYCRLGLSLLTSVDGVPLALVLREDARLVAFSNGTHEFDVLHGTRPPALHPNPEKSEVPDLMREVEAADMPYGLYADDRFVYILTRAPEVAGTRWELSRLSLHREGGRIEATVEGRATIPSRANHLTVIPGPETWAFVEKGPVRKLGLQDVDQILFVDRGNVQALGGHGGRLCPETANH